MNKIETSYVDVLGQWLARIRYRNGSSYDVWADTEEEAFSRMAEALLQRGRLSVY